MAAKLRKDDMVVIIAGNGKGKRGRVLAIDRDGGRITVEGVNFRKNFAKVRQTKDGQSGGIEERESHIHISNVALVDPKTNKGARVGSKKNNDGTRVRITKGRNASGTVIE